MSVLTPGPDKASRDGVDRNVAANLEQATARARWALAWERTWPHLATLLTIAGGFLAVSWAGYWTSTTLVWRIAGLVVFALLIAAALFQARHWRWPDREDALRRLDRGTGIRHRPATALSDNLTSQDPVARALWQVQRERTAAAIGTIKAGLPSPRLALHDPRALRALVVVLVVATFMAAPGERLSRLTAAFDWGNALSGANVRLDAWVTPPSYTGRPPVILAGGNNAPQADAADTAPMNLPAGSILLIRTTGAKLDVAITGGLTEVEVSDKVPAGSDEKRFLIGGDGSARVRAPSGHPLWRFAASSDKAPTIALAKEPERLTRGGLLLSYKLEDDFGVSEARAEFALRAPANATPVVTIPAPGTVLSERSKQLLQEQANRQVRPLYDPPTFPLMLPNARTRAGVGQTLRDLSEHPYAGADVTLTLIAKDEASNEGRSEPHEMRLPERLFSKPVARVLIEQRRILAMDANKRSLVGSAIEALLIEPDMFTPEAGLYLNLSSLQQQLARAVNDNALRESVDAMWALATLIEDGSTSDAEKALRAAQEALRQALDRGATDEEIKALTDQLRAALDNFMRQLAEQLRNNPQQLARPLDPNTRMLRQQDLKSMIDRMEREARNGNRDTARAMLDRLQQMLENLQMARPGQGGDSDMDQAQNELDEMIREQQRLRDRTFQQGQEQRRGNRNRGQNQNRNNENGEQDSESELSDLQRQQQGLIDRLQKLQRDLAQRGLGQRRPQRGQPGENQGAEQGDPGDDAGQELGEGLGDAEGQMGDADGKLGQGNADGAVDPQGRAIDALRRGADKLAQMRQGQGEGEGEGDGDPNNQFGQNRGRSPNGRDNLDPLSRETRGREYTGEGTQIPGEVDAQRARRILEELRRRLGEQARPQIELEYLERLLKDY